MRKLNRDNRVSTSNSDQTLTNNNMDITLIPSTNENMDNIKKFPMEYQNLIMSHG